MESLKLQKATQIVKISSAWDNSETGISFAIIHHVFNRHMNCPTRIRTFAMSYVEVISGGSV